MGIFATEEKIEFNGHQIVAIYSYSMVNQKPDWKLYIDGKIADSISALFLMAPKHAVLRGALSCGDKISVVEVYCRSVFNVRLEIIVNGEVL